MFVQFIPVVVVNFCKAGFVQAGHAGSLIQSGPQSDAAAFTHFGFAAPLAALTHLWIHAGIGQQSVKRAAARDEKIDQIVGGGGSFHFLLFSLEVMGGPLPKLVAK